MSTSFNQQALNQKVIAEFQANLGTLGGSVEGRSVPLLTTRGTKTGRVCRGISIGAL